MGLSLYKRHTAQCGQTSRRWRRCSCPVWVQGTLAGEYIRRSLDLTSIEAAEAIVFAWNRAGRIGSEGRKKPTPREAVLKFLADAEARQLSPETVLLYRRFLLGHFVPWCEARKYNDLARLDVRVIRDEYRTSWTWAASTASRRVERLRTFFAFCVESEWIDKNPAKSLKAPVVKDKPTLPFTDEEVTRVLAACDQLITHGSYGLENRARVRAFVLVLRYTGLRISDAAALDTYKVRNGLVFLYTAKTGQPVAVPIPEFVSRALEAVPRHGNRYFQTGEARGKTVRGSWDRTLRILFKLAGVEGGHAHRFRDTFAVKLLEAGTPIEDVSILLGHASTRVTERHYSPWVRSRQLRLEERVKAAWANEAPKLHAVS
jgi:integrase/recombinase XerD